MKQSILKKILILPAFLVFLSILAHSSFSQINADVVREGNLRFEQSIVNLRTTVEDGMNYLDNIDNNYLTKME